MLSGIGSNSSIKPPNFYILRGDENGRLSGLHYHTAENSLCIQRQINCQCSDCEKLNVFLKAKQQIITFTVNSVRRQHLHEMITEHVGNSLVRHVSRW